MGSPSPAPLAVVFPFLAAVLALLPLFACGGHRGGTEGSNLLLITCDTTRADALGCYGGPSWTTPNLDRLAREGVRFDRARTTAPITLPSHATILTGLYPFEHGVRDNGVFRLPGRAVTLAEKLKAAGYATGAVTGAFVLHSSFGLDQGFDRYLDVPRRKLNLGAEEDQRRADEVVDAALELLDGWKGGEPFFLWVHLFDPHHPYTPPEPFAARALEGRPPAATPPAERERRLYLGETAFMDGQIGRLLRALERRGLDRPLLTAVVADHGEGLGDHGEATHAFLLYDTTVRVPWILHHPALPAGRVVSRDVSTADLAPTLLGLLGIPFPEASGRDLSGELLGGRAAPEPSLCYFEAAHPYYDHRWAPLFGVVKEGVKLIEGPSPELYRTDGDPGERYDRAGEDASDAKRLRALFAPLARRVRPGARIALAPEDLDRIRSLGYTASAPRAGENPLVPGRVPPGLMNPKEGLRLWRKAMEARSLAEKGSLEGRARAAVLIDEVLAKNPDDPTFLAYAGSIYYWNGRYGDAAAVLRRSLAGLENPTTRDLLATCLYKLGRRANAVALLEENVALHPQELLSRYKLADGLLAMGKAEEALEQVEFFLRNYAARDALYERVLALKRGIEGRLPPR